MKSLAMCVYCKGEIHLENDANFIQGFGNIHRSCINSFLADEGGKANRFKMLFIGPQQKSLILWERIRASKDIFPDLEPNIAYAEGNVGIDRLKCGEFFDFIFLDALRAENLIDCVNIIKEKKGNARPRVVVFYGYYNPTELKCVEEWQLELGKLGMPVKIIKLHEIMFSRVREKNISHEERGEIESALVQL